MMGDSNELDHLENLYEMETFERGGRDLWEHMNDPRDPADVTALVVEACRVKDRLDRLHRMASRDDRDCCRQIWRASSSYRSEGCCASKGRQRPCSSS